MVLYEPNRTEVQIVPLIGDSTFGLSHTLHPSTVVVCSAGLYRKYLPGGSSKISRRNKTGIAQISWPKQNVGRDTRFTTWSRTSCILASATTISCYVSPDSLVDDCNLFWARGTTWRLDKVVRKKTDRYRSWRKMVGRENRLPCSVFYALDHCLWIPTTLLLPGTSPVLWISARTR